MGQGDYEPGCQYCGHVDTSREVRRCLQHGIPIPDLRSDGDFLCKDWKLIETSDKQLWSWIRRLPGQYKEELDAIKPGTLYYSAGYSQEGLPRPFWGKLDSLKSIKNYMFRAEVWSHRKYGWVIYPDSFRENYAHLPRVGRKCDLSLDGERFEFSVGRILWKRPKSIRTNKEGELIPVGWRRGTDRIVFSQESPDALKKWVSKYIDVDTMVREEGRMYGLEGGGISVFMEVIEPRESYSLRPTLHFHPRFVKDKALLKDE